MSLSLPQTCIAFLDVKAQCIAYQVEKLFGEITLLFINKILTFCNLIKDFNLFSELVEGNGNGNVLFVPNEYADTENDYTNEIDEDSLNEQAKEEAFEDYYDQLMKNVV